MKLWGFHLMAKYLQVDGPCGTSGSLRIPNRMRFQVMLTNSKFYNFYMVHHLLVEVYLVPPLPEYLDLCGGGPWWNMVVLGQKMKSFEFLDSVKFCCTNPKFDNYP